MDPDNRAQETGDAITQVGPADEAVQIRVVADATEEQVRLVY